MKLTPCLLAATLALLAACNRQQPADSDPGASQAPAAAKAALPPQPRFENLRVEERPSYDKKSIDWVVRATFVNAGAEPIDGGEFVIELHREGEAQAFAVHSTQVFFSPTVTTGKSTSFIATVPGSNVSQRPALSTVKASARLSKAMARPKVAAGWKPLDPTTATPKVVGDTVIIDAAGNRRTVTSASAQDQQAVAEASNPFKNSGAAYPVAPPSK